MTSVNGDIASVDEKDSPAAPRPGSVVDQEAVSAAIAAALAALVREALAEARGEPEATVVSVGADAIAAEATVPAVAPIPVLLVPAEPVLVVPAEPVLVVPAEPVLALAPSSGSEPSVPEPVIAPVVEAPIEARMEPGAAPTFMSERVPVAEAVPAAVAEPVAVEPSDAPPLGPASPRPASWRDTAWRMARIGGYVVGGYLALVAGLLVVYRFVNPPVSALMAWRWVGGTEIHQVWVPIEAISPNLIRAVVVSEDGRFCSHRGIDLAAIKEALERSRTIYPRGASTISMQVVKNVFLWPSKSYVRKVVEIPITLGMEALWPKWRILEIYLNVAEWAPGVFGAEEAAQHHFKKPAIRLSERESAQLAVSLPNPFRRDAGDPGPRVAQRASVIQARARSEGEAADCVLSTLERSTAAPAKGTGARAGL